jgi:ERCC4-type nuclease
MKKTSPKIIVDTRESVYVIGYLEELGADIELRSISPGDYIVAKGFAIERKTVGDFLRSIYDKRLFEQMERLSRAYPRYSLLVEGNIGYELAHLKNPLVFWGALAKLVSEFNPPIIFTMNERQTAEFIFSIAKKCQEEKEKAPIARYKPKAYTLTEMQLLAVQGLPGIGPKMADRLLKRFKTVRRIFTAHPIELRGVPGMGKKKEKIITEFLDALYSTEEKESEAK